MSLRILIKPDQIQNWIAERHGTPARRRDADADLAVLFDGEKPEYEALSVDDLLETMRLNHLVLLVDQETDKKFHKFVQHG
jgi:hypothetical protein